MEVPESFDIYCIMDQLRKFFARTFSCWNSSAFLCSFIFFQIFATIGFSKTIPLASPADEDVEITVDRNIIAVFRDGKQIYLLAHKRNSLIAIPYNEKGKTSEEKFGKFIDSKRTEINKRLQEVAWRGATKYGEKILVLDGLAPSFVELAPKKDGFFEEVNHHNIPRDILSPPRDRIGEPSKPETAKLRANFAKNFAKLGESPRFSGITEIPANFSKEKSVEYYLASKVAGFPLLKIGCDNDNVKSCRITRSCWINGLPGFNGDKVTGVAVSAKRKLLLMGDSSKQTIHVFKAESCLNIRYSHTLSLPPEIKHLSNLFVDSDDLLWLTSSEPDVKRDASLYLFKNW